MKNGLIMLVLAAGSGLATAGTINAKYVHVAGNSGAAHLRVGGTTYFAGHMVHEYTGGVRTGQRFATFCIDLGESAVNSPKGYQLVDLADAPMPGTPYGQVIAGRINAVVANAVALGWIDNRLQADAGQANYLGRMGAIQAAIWDAMDLHVDIDDPASSDAMRAAYQTLLDNSTFDPTLRLANLRAVANQDRQDMLYIVPLPPAV